MAEFSDYIIYADESGSPVLDGIDPTFPLFVLVFVLIRKEAYMKEIVPEIQRLKFDFVGHDQLVLHERDIRRQSRDFAFLQTDRDLRARFIERINSLVGSADIEIFAAVVFKDELKDRYADPWSPYSIALHLCAEKCLARLVQLEQAERRIHVVFESRGKREDTELELQFRRIANNDAHWGWRRPDFTQLDWEPVFVDKRANSAGLQLADLTARPIGLKCLRPKQPNRAYEVIRAKLGFNGVKQFPKNLV